MKRFSPNWRDYSRPTLKPATMEYPEPELDEKMQAMIELVNEYAAENGGDRETPLCMKHNLCRKLEGHR